MLYVQSTIFYVGTGLSGLNQYYVSCSRTQRSDAGEARTRSPVVYSLFVVAPLLWGVWFIFLKWFSAISSLASMLLMKG